MDYKEPVAKLKELLEKAKSVVVVTHEHPTADSLGSALSLYLGLQSLGKTVSIACPDAMTVELSGFVGVQQVIKEFGKKNFVISLDYVEGSIEKVSYNIEGAKFNLVIENRPGHEPFTAQNVQYTYSGAAADLIIAVDTIHLGGLKKLYEVEKDLFASVPIVNIDRHPNNAMYGQLNIVNPQTATTAEVIAHILSGIGVKLSQDIATNILNALVGGTNGFQSPTLTPSVLEIAAVCMRAGGKRFAAPVAVQEEKPKEEVTETPTVDTTIPEVKKETKPTESVAPQQTPADWLKPKIFKSSHLL